MHASCILLQPTRQRVFWTLLKSCFPPEDLGFRLCQFLAKRGQMRRLAPGTKRMYEEHPLSNIWAVGAPYMILYYVFFKYLAPGLVERAYISLNPLDVWPFLW